MSELPTIRLTRCACVPLKVSRAFCPSTRGPTETGCPLGVIADTLSVGTLCTLMLALLVIVSHASSTISYVPVDGRTRVSMYVGIEPSPPLVENPAGLD